MPSLGSTVKVGRTVETSDPFGGEPTFSAVVAEPKLNLYTGDVMGSGQPQMPD